MARLGIVQSTKRASDRIAVEDLVSLADGDIEVLELRQERGNIEEQILKFLDRIDAVVFVLLTENSTLHFIAGLAVGLRKKIGYLCDSSIYLPFSFREYPFSIIQRTEDLELAIVSVAQKIMPNRNDALFRSLQNAAENAVRQRRSRVSRTSSDRFEYHKVPESIGAVGKPEASENEGQELEADWTRRLAETLSSPALISASANLEDERKSTFDLILWNSDRENALALFENPIAVEVKTTRKLNSRAVTEALNSAQKQNIRSVLLITRASIPPSRKSEYILRARKKGVTLGLIDAVPNEAIDSRDDLLSRLSSGQASR